MIRFNINQIIISAQSLLMSFNCISITNSNNLRQLFPIITDEKVVYLSLGVLSLFFAIINIVSIAKVKSLRQPPMDILIILMIFSITKTLIVFVTIIYDDIYSPGQIPQDFQNFCLATGVISIIAHSTKITYSILMSIIYIKKVKNPLKAWISDLKQIHFICIFIIIIITLSFAFTNNIGMSLYGYCSVKFSPKNIFVLPSIDLAFFVALLVLSVIFLKRVKKLSAQRRFIHQFFNIYLLFIILFVINQLIITVSQFIVVSKCQSQSDFEVFNAFRILSTTASFSISFFVFVIILRNQQFRRTFLLSLREDLNIKFKKTVQYIKRNKTGYDQSRNSVYDEFLTTNRNSIYIELQNMIELENGYLVNLKDKNRACLLSSLLGCICIQQIQQKNQMVDLYSTHLRTSAIEDQDVDQQEQYFAFNYYQNYSFIINNSMVEHYAHVFNKQMPSLYLKFVSYSPAVMKKFAQMNRITNLQQKLSPILNEQAIIKDCKASAQGGRSGQFFFFNSDNTLIIKTLTQEQKFTFLQRIKQFHCYFMKNKASLIVKLYSIFTIINTDTSDQINFMLMGNMLRGLSGQYVLRCYDLKGSLHHRQVMKNQNVIQSQRVKRTMKDIDFMRFQQKIWLSEEDAQQLIKNIVKDSQFFCSLGLIDYSLIVMKLDLKSIEKVELQSKILQQLKIYKSQKEEGIGYLFGLIDYLETWNIRKKGQKWYKSLFVKSSKISSQDPYFYSQRFIQFSRLILASN